MPKGPEFSTKNAGILAKRAAQWCSNPDCLNKTSGPHSEQGKAINLGEAAHIRGGKPGSARYDPNMTDEQRSDISNGIWLCTGCAKEIDKDERRFPVKLLLIWKDNHESTVQHKGIKTYSDPHAHQELNRLQRENTELRRENEDIHQKLKSKEDFESRYKLVQTSGGAWVYASLENPTHYVCQSCWDNKGNREILCDQRVPSGHFECPGCKNTYRVNPSQQVQQTHAKSGMRKYGWMD